MLFHWILALLLLIPFFLFLSVFLPKIQWMLVAFWILSVTFDIFSTHKFYLENPGEFSQNERNKVFVLLTEKLGFKKASATFPVIFEIPLLLFFALFPLQTLYAYMFHGSPFNFPACLAASFGIAAIGHIQAASKNMHSTTEKSTSPSEHATVYSNACMIRSPQNEALSDSFSTDHIMFSRDIFSGHPSC